MKKVLLLSLLSFSLINVYASDTKKYISQLNNIKNKDKDKLNRLLSKLKTEQCESDLISLQPFNKKTDKTTTTLSLQGPSINCNGEIEINKNQFEEMGKKLKKMLQEVLSNVKLFVEAEAKKTIIEGSISIIAYLIVFKPSTPAEVSYLAQSMATCVSNVASQSVKQETSPGGGDESNVAFLGVDLGKIGEVTECIKNGAFPKGMTKKQLAQYTKKKKQIKKLLNALLSGNINLMIDIGSFHETGWCDNVKNEYKKESGLLLGEMDNIVLLDGSIMNTSYVLTDENKDDKKLKTIKEKEKKFQKSISRQFTIQTGIIREEDFKFVNFLDMLEKPYTLFLQEMKTKWEEQYVLYDLTQRQKMLLEFIKNIIFNMKLEDGTTPPYYYTLYFLNKPVSFYYELLINNVSGKKVTINGIDNNFLNNISAKEKNIFKNNPKAIKNLKQIKLIKNAITLEFINKYELIKQTKFEIYNTQLPILYGHVENETFNNFIERDNIKNKTREYQENTIFNLQMILKKMYDSLDNDIVITSEDK